MHDLVSLDQLSRSPVLVSSSSLFLRSFLRTTDIHTNMILIRTQHTCMHMHTHACGGVSCHACSGQVRFDERHTISGVVGFVFFGVRLLGRMTIAHIARSTDVFFFPPAPVGGGQCGCVCARVQHGCM